MFNKLKSPKALARPLVVVALVVLAFLTPRFACSRAHPVTFGSVMTTSEKASYDAHIAITSGNPHGVTAGSLVGGLPAASTAQAGTESLADFTTFSQMGHTDRGYVDAVASSNQATLTGLAQTIDGVTLSVAGQRVLLPSQTTSTQDGCYTIASGAWTRCVHMPVGLAAAGSFYTARFGTANTGVWTCTNAVGSDVVGTNDLTFINISSGMSAGQVTKLAGIETGATNTFNPAAVSGFFEDFAALANGVAWTSQVSATGFSVFTSGTGAAVSVATAANSDTETHIVTLSSGTTTSGLASIYNSVGGNGAGYAFTTPTASQVVLDLKISIPTLSTGVEAHNIIAGALASASASATSGIFFNIDSNADSHFIGNCRSASTTSSVTTTVSAVAATYYHLVATKNAAANTVTFSIDGAGQGTVSANCPTTVAQIPIVLLQKSAGTTARTVNVDWVGLRRTYPRAL